MQNPKDCFLKKISNNLLCIEHIKFFQPHHRHPPRPHGNGQKRSKRLSIQSYVKIIWPHVFRNWDFDSNLWDGLDACDKGKDKEDSERAGVE